jgi:hypothetical protein
MYIIRIVKWTVSFCCPVMSFCQINVYLNWKRLRKGETNIQNFRSLLWQMYLNHMYLWQRKWRHNPVVSSVSVGHIYNVVTYSLIVPDYDFVITLVLTYFDALTVILCLITYPCHFFDSVNMVLHGHAYILTWRHLCYTNIVLKRGKWYI